MCSFSEVPTCISDSNLYIGLQIKWEAPTYSSDYIGLQLINQSLYQIATYRFLCINGVSIYWTSNYISLLFICLSVLFKRAAHSNVIKTHLASIHETMLASI